MQVISASEARNNFSEILSLVAFRGEEFEVRRKGKPVAVILPQKSKKKVSKKSKALKAIEKLSKLNVKLPTDDWSELKKIITDMHMPHM